MSLLWSPFFFFEAVSKILCFFRHCCVFPLIAVLKQKEQTTQDTPVTTPFAIPLLCFAYKTPPDGLPVYEDWVSHAMSIWTLGYEAWREPVELKPLRSDSLGAQMEFGFVEACKGVGRLAILLFTVAYTYKHYSSHMTEEESEDFTRPPLRRESREEQRR